MDKVLPGDLLGICIGELIFEFAFKNSVENIAAQNVLRASAFLVPITTFGSLP